MRPRSFERGKQEITVLAGKSSGFNEAALFRTRKAAMQPPFRIAAHCFNEAALFRTRKGMEQQMPMEKVATLQ